MSGNKLAAKWQQLRSILPEWNRPPAGKQLDLKEWIMFILGSIGCYGATTMTPFVTLTQGIYVAAACSINVDHVALIGVISSIIAIVTTPLISWLLDNTNTRWGKFRPYLLFFPIPLGTGLLTAVGMGTAFIAPAIYKSFGYIDSTSVLYQHETLFGIARAIAGLSLGSLVLGAIPFFFWDLTERKHNKMMEILAVRARLADGEIDEEEAAVQEREMKGDEML